MKCLSIFIRVALLALAQSLDCHSASEVSLMNRAGASTRFTSTSTSTSTCNMCEYEYESEYLIIT